MRTRMSQAINAVKSLIEEKGWKYTFDSDKNRIKLGFKLKSKLAGIDIVIGFRESSNDPGSCLRVFSYGMIDLHADENCMADVCEYITRANYGLAIGKFELDHSDGEIRYNVSINVLDGMPGDDALDDLVSMPVMMFDKYGDGLLAVSMGMMSAKDACQKAES